MVVHFANVASEFIPRVLNCTNHGRLGAAETRMVNHITVPLEIQLVAVFCRLLGLTADLLRWEFKEQSCIESTPQEVHA